MFSDDIQRLTCKLHIRKLGSTDDKTRWSSHAQLVKIGKPTVPFLVEALDDKNPTRRSMAAATLGEMQCKDGKAISALIGKINDPDVGVRRSVYWALAQIKNSKAVEPLLAQLALEENNEVIGEILKAFTLIKDKRAVPALIELLENTEGEELIGGVAEALGNIGDPRAVPILLKKFIHEEHERKKILMTPVYALGHIKDKSAVQPLIDALQNKELYSRNWAAVGLGMIGDGRAVEPLMKVLEENKDPKLFGATVVAFGAIGDARPLPLLIQLMISANTHKFNYIVQSISKICERYAKQGKETMGLKEVWKKLDALVRVDHCKGEAHDKLIRGRARIVYRIFSDATRKAREKIDAGILTTKKPNRPPKSKNRLVRIRRIRHG